MKTIHSPLFLAFVGMPGSGKTEAALYVKDKGNGYVRFGDVTEEVLREKQLEITPENEQTVRESLRTEFGMAIFAEKSLPKLQTYREKDGIVVIDGLYSWEEYLFLKKRELQIFVIHVYTEKVIRYQRLARRKVRPLTTEEAIARDIAEIEKLNKSGPIAIADFLVENNGTQEELYRKLEVLLERIQNKGEA